MYTVDLYLRVRLACHVDGLSQREAASRFGIARETVRKMLRHSEPPGYRRRQPPKRPKLAPFTDIIDRILEEDRTVHRKQHHTAKRIFERLRDEHGFTGKETIVKDYVRERRLRRREMFVPLSHPPGHAQADFGEADAIIAGVKYRAHFFVMTLPHSDACFVAAYPAAATEAWLDGHNRAFVFFGGVPQSILYDNDKCLVSRILSDGTRQRTRAFSGLQSHYLFEDRYGRPGKNAIKWTRLSCRKFDHNAVRLQLHALAYNLGNFMRTLALPDSVEQWSLTTLREKLIKIGAKIVRHGRYVIFQMAEVAIPRDLFADILRRIDRLRPTRTPA